MVVCETMAAITTHLRVVDDEHPIRLSGHSVPPATLCGMSAAWDTQLPLNATRCNACRLKAAEAGA